MSVCAKFHIVFYKPKHLVADGFSAGGAEVDRHFVICGANPFGQIYRLGMGIALRPRRACVLRLHGVGSLRYWFMIF